MSEGRTADGRYIYTPETLRMQRDSDDTLPMSSASLENSLSTKTHSSQGYGIGKSRS